MKVRALFRRVLLPWMLLAAAACENDANRSGTERPPPDDTNGNGGTIAVVDPGFLRRFSPPPPNPGKGAVLFTISGEALATEGFAFPKTSDQEVTFVDGWSLSFERLLVTVDGITLADAPDSDGNDPEKTGKVVARATGPWAVDLAKNDPSYPRAKGGEGRAVPLAALAAQNANGGAAFDTAGERYAFGFDTVPASRDAINVNLGPAALADYERMIVEGCTSLYVGTATWNGDASGVTCAPAPGTNEVLDALPKQVAFRLCFKTPTSNLNCQNPDNDPAAPLAGEEHQRGVAFRANTSTTAQLTFHVDHTFWLSVEEDSPATFDAFAAAAVPNGESATLSMENLAAVDFQNVRTRDNAPLPYRNCVASDWTPPPGNVSFYSGSVQNVGPTGDPASGLRSLADFAAFTTSTQAHMNADGVCYVRRRYASPN